MQLSRQKKAECAYCRIPMERASGYSENSGMGMAVCPPVAFSELVSGISIAPLQRTRFTVRTDPKENRGELLGSFKAIKMIEEWYGPTLLWVSALSRTCSFYSGVDQQRINLLACWFSERRPDTYNVYEGVGRCNNVLLIFHLLLP